MPLRTTLIVLLAAALLSTAAPAAAVIPLAPDTVVVGYRQAVPASASAPPRTRVIHLPAGSNLERALQRLRSRPGVAWAVPDPIAHIANFAPPPSGAPRPAPIVPLVPAFVPNDPGPPGTAGGWPAVQWNFVGPFGVNAPQAWRNLATAGRPGARGVTVAVLDTGVAYARRGIFHKSPDFASAQFVRGYDFVDNSPYPNDREGHGTHVAGTIAEATNNGVGLTGLAYGVRIMPVRVLNSSGDGDASNIAAGVLFAVKHHAQVINMSLEFTSEVTAATIPELISAIRYAHRRGVLVVAAAGNEGAAQISYPARAPFVISVGATTEHGCVADFGNYGPGLDIVAPGGGADAAVPGDPNCRPAVDPVGRDIYQETFGRSPRIFGFPGGYEGTSMAAPHVSAVAALVIASGVLGAHPSPDQIVARLKATSRPIGPPGDTGQYGAGLLDAAAATNPATKFG
ncbi:MAG: hypothetical protein NVSMB51_00980 [Solirubrobacteraceae bacterium]